MHYGEYVCRMTTRTGAGPLIRQWRTRRRFSQLALAAEAGVSQRHLSFMETGRASPSREMLVHLGEVLAVPLRDRNTMLTAAGFAPVYRERSLDSPEMKPIRSRGRAPDRAPRSISRLCDRSTLECSQNHRSHRPIDDDACRSGKLLPSTPAST